MKTTKTLVSDIQALINTGEFDAEIAKRFAAGLGETIGSRLSGSRHTPSLRISNLGTPNRKLWYSINRPELGTPLSPSARLKFLFGDILEELLLYLAEQSGHTVEDRQREVEIDGVKGHIDARIDGELVDVKSASSFSFKKFASGGLRQDDPFGYISQLGGYAHALGLDRGSFLVIDKTLGHLTLDTHVFSKSYSYSKVIADKRKMLDWPQPPERCYPDEPDGKSGNRKLGVSCSYCAFKSSCWPGLRVFDYAGRPVFLTRVAREPRVQELKLNEVEL